jgi:hypothetical protein
MLMGKAIDVLRRRVVAPRNYQQHRLLMSIRPTRYPIDDPSVVR